MRIRAVHLVYVFYAVHELQLRAQNNQLSSSDHGAGSLPQDPSQQLAARILRDSVHELDPR